MEILELLKTLDFSNFGWQIATPIIFSVADIITGLIQAIINDDVKSKKMREGLLHKTLIIIVLLLSVVASETFSINIISKFVSVYIILMETISIFENLKKAGVDFDNLLKIFIKKEDKKENEKKTTKKDKGTTIGN